MQQETLMAITSMLTGLGIPHGSDPDVLIRTYAISVQGVREDCIMDVCGSFIRGELKPEGFRKGRAPTTDVFSTSCREEASARTARERRAAMPRVEHRKPTYEQSQDQRENMLILIGLWRKAQYGDRSAQEELRRRYPNASDPWRAKYPNLFENEQRRMERASR